jgi:hypothetical protein
MFWMHMMELLGDLCHVESRFSPFAESANLDARLVHTIGSEVILDAPNGTPR